MFENSEKRRVQELARVEGGYRLIGVTELFAAWWSYEQGHIQFRDLRTYFALHEMASRRCGMSKGRTPHYALDELRRLVGGTAPKSLAASVRRLQTADVSTWNKTALSFNDFESLHPIPNAILCERLGQIANRRRRVPVPRRTLRWLAKAQRPVLVATVLGHLFRCVYAKGHLVAAEGSISANWVAGVFGVDPRTVKRAKAQLRALNWLADLPSNHWHQQRYGGSVLVNLAWAEGKGSVFISRNVLELNLPPPPTPMDPNLPPPDSNRKLLTESKYQKPAAPRPSGVQKPCPRTPALRNIQPEDLRDAGRLLVLLKQAQERGLVGKSEHDRLQFMSAAARASTKATRNPGGFFWRLIQQRLWHHITTDDESKAHIMLKRHLFPTGGKDRPQLPPPPDPARCCQTEADIRLVAQLTQSLQSHGITGDPFVHLAQHDPRWTRERWNRAYRGWLIPEGSAVSAEPSPNHCPR